MESEQSDECIPVCRHSVGSFCYALRLIKLAIFLHADLLMSKPSGSSFTGLNSLTWLGLVRLRNTKEDNELKFPDGVETGNVGMTTVLKELGLHSYHNLPIKMGTSTHLTTNAKLTTFIQKAAPRITFIATLFLFIQEAALKIKYAE